MHKTHYLIILALAIGIIPNIGYAQSNEIRIRYIGNCGLYFTDGRSNIYFDFPYKSGAYHYATYPKSELDSVKRDAVFIFTHRHADHYSKKLVKRAKAKAYGPWNTTTLLKATGALPDFSIQPIKTKHKFSFKHASYLMTWHSKKIFISGDAENSDTIHEMKDLDCAFVPAWLLLDAMEKKYKIDTKKIGLYHIGPRDNISIDTPGKILPLRQADQTITIPF